MKKKENLRCPCCGYVYNKKKRKPLPEALFWDKIIRGFNKFLEPPK